MAQGLREAGFQVATAASGEQAIELAKEATFDLALLDIRMPGLSGIETAQHLRITHGLPAMFMTAYGEQALVRDAIDKGGLAYAMKPIDIAQLIPAISTALARAQDLRALREVRSQLEQALATGRETSMAIGIVMERRCVGEKAAFELLRSNARARQRKLNDYCHDVIVAAEQLNGLSSNTADAGLKPQDV
jgi:response regulator NasT